MNDTNNLVTAAEKEIAKVLAKLEADTGMVLDMLKVRDIEITTVVDKSPRLWRHVVLEMKRLPSTRWDQ